MKPNSKEHLRNVDAFLSTIRETNPELYARICQKYPVLTRKKHITIRRRERPFSDFCVESEFNNPELLAIFGVEDDDNGY
jgi:hypothetical protein